MIASYIQFRQEPEWLFCEYALNGSAYDYTGEMFRMARDAY
jgi:hypothetical protein